MRVALARRADDSPANADDLVADPRTAPRVARIVGPVRVVVPTPSDGDGDQPASQRRRRDPLRTRPRHAAPRGAATSATAKRLERRARRVDAIAAMLGGERGARPRNARDARRSSAPLELGELAVEVAATTQHRARSQCDVRTAHHSV